MDTELVQVLQRHQAELRRELGEARASLEKAIEGMRDRHQDSINMMQGEIGRLSGQVIAVQTELAGMRERAKADSRMLHGEIETLSKAAGGQLEEHEAAILALREEVTSFRIGWNRVMGIILGAAVASGLTAGGVGAWINAIQQGP